MYKKAVLYWQLNEYKKILTIIIGFHGYIEMKLQLTNSHEAYCIVYYTNTYFPAFLTFNQKETKGEMRSFAKLQMNNTRGNEGNIVLVP